METVQASPFSQGRSRSWCRPPLEFLSCRTPGWLTWLSPGLLVLPQVTVTGSGRRRACLRVPLSPSFPPPPCTGVWWRMRRHVAANAQARTLAFFFFFFLSLLSCALASEVRLPEPPTSPYPAYELVPPQKWVQTSSCSRSSSPGTGSHSPISCLPSAVSNTL